VLAGAIIIIIIIIQYDFNCVFLTLGIYTTEGEKIIIIIIVF